MSVPEPPFAMSTVGIVRSPLRDPVAAPRQGDEGAPEAWIDFDPAIEAALEGIRAGDEILLFSWLHLAQRDLLRVHPRGDPARTPQGVFSTRSPHRPNPIGLHRVQVVRVEGARMLVRNLEAVDGTPIVDVKPVLEDDPAER